ncbi:MAG: MBOAT family protein [Crocinitomicaceae bacterium]|nr:MBOAT family protein [Crocinitomicaceae bacterium]
MVELFTSWGIGDLFNRLITTFDWHIRDDGTALSFNKLDFWIFFLAVMIMFSFVSKQKIVRSIFLTAVSLFFFYKTSGLYMILLIVSVAFNYFLGKNIYNSNSDAAKKWIITISATFNLLILGYFKYAYFFTDSFNEVFGTHNHVVNHFALLGNHFIEFGNGFWGTGSFVEKIMLPVGVSFFTFQNISYVVDIYRKEIKPVNNFFHYSFFVTFFPQLVMGPIVRAKDFIPQIEKPYKLTKDDFSWSVIQIVKGLGKKMVLADFVVFYFINEIVYKSQDFPGWVSVLAMFAYSLHIYADFSGYTDIATGLSKLMGFQLKPNFNSPYKAKNVGDFWRRWHMSLGSWLKDYLYIPLGGNRTGGLGSYIAILCIFTFILFITQWWELLWVYAGLTVIYLLGVALFKNFKRFVHRDLNLLITMVIGGLWHGASENFVIWGIMNGTALVLFKYWKQINSFFREKSSILYFIKPVIFYLIYIGIYKMWPHAWHIAIVYFLYFWMAMNTIVFIMRLLIKAFNSKLGEYYSFWTVFFATLVLLTAGGFLYSDKNLAYLGIIPIVLAITLWACVISWTLITHFYGDKEQFYGKMKTRYIGFWQIFFTFGFISLTRIWFKLDDARYVKIKGSDTLEFTTAEVEEMPYTMLDQMWFKFDFQWDYFVRFIELYYIPIIVVVIGLIIHWIPRIVKQKGENIFMKLPIWVQMICVSIIVVLMYQALTAEQVPFVYMLF